MLHCDWLTDDDDQDSSHYLKSQGEGDEGQDSDVVPEGETHVNSAFYVIIHCKCFFIMVGKLSFSLSVTAVAF